MTTKRYTVETCFTPGVWTVIRATDDADRAVETTNFWDERQDTRLIDEQALTPLERALRRFDAAIDALRPGRPLVVPQWALQHVEEKK